MCKEGHNCTPRPSTVRKGLGICRTCSAAKLATGKADFLETLAQHGAILAPGAQYANGKTRGDIICSRGHSASPRPASVHAGAAICITCDKGSYDLQTRFFELVRDLGGEVTTGSDYEDLASPVEIVCAAGHKVSPRPRDVVRTGVLCQHCAQAPKDRFLEAVRRQGARLADGELFVNTKVKVILICKAGHACTPAPSSVIAGQGVCKTCAGVDPAASRERFLRLVLEQGATLAPGSDYTGKDVAVRLVCRNGHMCTPMPSSIFQGRGVCRTCAGFDPVAAEVKFRALMVSYGATIETGEVYKGSTESVRAVCANGHSCNPVPAEVIRGRGFCRACVISFNRVYLLRHREVRCLKVGVASTSERVTDHLRRGYELVDEWLDLSHSQAVFLEHAVLSWWRSQGWSLVAGAPKDGRTETCSDEHLRETLSYVQKQRYALDTLVPDERSISDASF